MRNSLLVVMLLPLGASAAWAETPLTQLMLTPHAVDAKQRVGAGTVNFASGTTAYFASADATYGVQLKRGKPVLTRSTGHPEQAHHHASDSITIDGQSVLVMLADDRKGLKLARFDAMTKSWADVERPLGFVPGAHAVVEHQVVFPQRARTQKWFVYDGRKNEFRSVGRPDDVTPCEGATFAWKKLAVVAGVDPDGTPCAVSYEPAIDAWRQLPAPPHAPGSLIAATKSKAFLIEGGRPTLGWDGKRWTSHASAPSFTGQVQQLVGAKQLVFWQSERHEIVQSVFDVGRDAWTQTREMTVVELTQTVEIGQGHWVGAARLQGKPGLVELRWDPSTPMKERMANRTALAPNDEADHDWTKASEAERHAAIAKGLGAVERYVPPVTDEHGKIETKGAWIFALGEELVVWPVTPKQCRRFLEKMLTKWPTQTFGSTWSVQRGEGFARSGKHWVYTPTGQCRERQKCPSDYFSERFQPLSQVGPVFSYSRHRSAAVDCGEPSSEERWFAIDLRTNEPAELTAMVEGPSMLLALKRHKKLGKVVGEAATLEAAIEALRGVDPEALGGYAFGRWRAASREVQLLLAFRPDRFDTVEPIRVWVEPKSEFIEIFERATRADGAYMGGSE